VVYSYSTKIIFEFQLRLYNGLFPYKEYDEINHKYIKVDNFDYTRIKIEDGDYKSSSNKNPHNFLMYTKGNRFDSILE
jgi:hypothetical protein